MKVGNKIVLPHSQKLGMLYSKSWFTNKLESMGFVIPASSIFS